MGGQLLQALTTMIPRYEFLSQVPGKGLMIGIEFGPPRSLKLKASWHALETSREGLFCQLITMPLLKEHKILSQVSSHTSSHRKNSASSCYFRGGLRTHPTGFRVGYCR